MLSFRSCSRMHESGKIGLFNEMELLTTKEGKSCFVPYVKQVVGYLLTQHQILHIMFKVSFLFWSDYVQVWLASLTKLIYIFVLCSFRNLQKVTSQRTKSRWKMEYISTEFVVFVNWWLFEWMRVHMLLRCRGIFDK